MKIILLIFLLIFKTEAKAVEELPQWVKQTPPADSEYKYYVGRSEGLYSEASAYMAADQNAREMALKDNFGSNFQISTVNTDNLYSVNSLSRIQEVSRKVNLNGFEKIEDALQVIQDRSTKEQKYIRYILYKYSKLEIKKELIRLEDNNQDITKFNISGQKEDCDKPNKTNFFINANNSIRAKVLINNDVVGYTPILISCHLIDAPTAKITIDHPNYKTYIQDVPIEIGGTTKIEAVLENYTTNLTINSTPSGAELFKDGLNIGTTPYTLDNLQAGVSYIILLKHPEAKDVYQEVLIDKKTDPTKNFYLPFKPSFLTIQTDPVDASVIIDNDPAINTPITKISCQAGQRKISITKEGYKPLNDTLTCYGGDTVTKNYVLEKYSGANLRLGLNLIFYSSSFKGIDLNYAGWEYYNSYRFVKNLNIHATLSLVKANQQYANLKLESSAIGTSFGVSFLNYIDDNYNSFYQLGIEAAFAQYTFTSIYNDNSTASTSPKSQLSYGLMATYKHESNLFSKISLKANQDSGDIKGQFNVSLSLGYLWSL